MLVLLAAGSQVVQGGSTLGEAIRKAPAVSKEEKAMAQVQNGQMRCELLHLDLCKTLILPDCSFGAESYAASEGSVLVLVRGRVTNTSKTSVVFQIPEFLSPGGRQYEEVDAVHYRNTKDTIMGLKLNPGQQHAFVCFFSVPVADVLNGSLLFEKDMFYLEDDDTTTMALPLNEDAIIRDSITLSGVTDM